MFPNDCDVLISHAWAAHDRADWPAALRRWERVLVAFPEQREPRRCSVQLLMELRRPSEAALVLTPALRLYPDDPALFVLNAWIATHRGDLMGALSLWQGVRKRFPDELDCYVGAWLELCRGVPAEYA